MPATPRPTAMTLTLQRANETKTTTPKSLLRSRLGSSNSRTTCELSKPRTPSFATLLQARSDTKGSRVEGCSSRRFASRAFLWTLCLRERGGVPSSKRPRTAGGDPAVAPEATSPALLKATRKRGAQASA
eukprot:Amastigsp_a349289_26.p2 type:complete len:130 gc:universal Amastigsp_a349289_26:481-870(+)